MSIAKKVNNAIPTNRRQQVGAKDHAAVTPLPRYFIRRDNMNIFMLQGENMGSGLEIGKMQGGKKMKTKGPGTHNSLDEL